MIDLDGSALGRESAALLQSGRDIGRASARSYLNQGELRTLPQRFAA
jgi:hypothetical protein